MKDDIHRQIYYGIRVYPKAFVATAIIAFNLGLAFGALLHLLTRNAA